MFGFIWVNLYISTSKLECLYTLVYIKSAGVKANICLLGIVQIVKNINKQPKS